MHKQLVTVVVPIHLEEPTELEKISLRQILAVLHRHPITFMAPETLNTAWYEDFCVEKATVRFERFDWHGFNGYSELMLAPVFYRRFQAYEYVLVCHLDAFVFRDELLAWCQLGYDYVGSVIYNHHWSRPSSRWRRLSGFAPPAYYGNGGFALKKVATFLRITKRFKLYIGLYHLARKLQNQRSFYDDIFLANHFPKLSRRFSIAPKAVAERFAAAYEDWAETDLPFTNQDQASLPFGTHGWTKFNREFWEPCIRRCGYHLPSDLVPSVSA